MPCSYGERIIKSYTRAHLESMKVLSGILIQTSSIYTLLQKQFKIQADEKYRKSLLEDSLDDKQSGANSFNLNDLQDILNDNNNVGNNT
jgi:hypothetical protein